MSKALRSATATSAPDDPLARLEQAARRQSLDEQALKAVSFARAKLVLGKDAASTFFATLALRLKVQTDWTMPTAWVDGKHLAVNPEWFTSLPLEQQKAVIVHEVMHLAAHHEARRQGREMKRSNLAADLSINGLIEEAGFKLPACRAMPGEGQYAHLPRGKSYEEYYALLEPPPEPQQPRDPEGGDPPEPGDGEGEGDPDPGGCGGVKDAGDQSQAAAKQSEAEWEVAVAQAQQVAKQRGKLPGGIDRLIAELLNPKPNVADVLREFVNQAAKNDYQWSPPNRRFIHQGLYLPGLRSEELGDVVFSVDCSGSINEAQIIKQGEQIQGVLENYHCRAVIIYHDAAVAGVDYWEPSDGPLVMKPRGGGGTSHRCVFDWIREQGLEPTCMVALTDLYSEFPEEPPNYPVLWAVVGNPSAQAPFGALVQVD